MIAKTPIVPHFSQYVRIDKPHISNSYLLTLKRALLGEKQFYGSEAHLVFGTEHHKRILEPEQPWSELQSPKQELQSAGMRKVTDADPRFQQILQGAERELVEHFWYRGVLVQIRVDILKRPVYGWDYKTTTAKSDAEFLRKARELDYWQQVLLYQLGTGVNTWGIVGQDKDEEEPEATRHRLFWLAMNDYPLYFEEAKDQLDYLVDTHKVLRSYYEHKANSRKNSDQLQTASGQDPYLAQVRG